jgi:hypothetical protein
LLQCRHAVVKAEAESSPICAATNACLEKKMRAFVACLLAVAIVAGGAYAVLRSVQEPRPADTYSYTTGSSRGYPTAPFDGQERVYRYGVDE